MNNPFSLPFDRPPEFINEIGVKYWLDRDSTAYAKQKGLDNVQVLFRVIAENQLPVYENPRIEDILVHIDIMRLAKND